jgi:hypothetical protein
LSYPTITGYGTFTSTGGTSATFSLTASAGEAVIVPVCAEKPSSAGFTLSINGGGVTWQQRGLPITVQKSVSLGDTVFVTTNVFYGEIVAGITAQTITITATGTIDDLAGGYVRTANPIGPYDTNPTLPSTAIGAAGTPPATTIAASTTDLDDLVYVVAGSASLGLGTSYAMNSGTTSALATILFLTQNSGGAAACSCIFGYGTYAAAQSNLMVVTEVGQGDVAFIVDALSGTIPASSNFFFAAD